MFKVEALCRDTTIPLRTLYFSRSRACIPAPWSDLHVTTAAAAATAAAVVVVLMPLSLAVIHIAVIAHLGQWRITQLCSGTPHAIRTATTTTSTAAADALLVVRLCEG